MAPHAFPKSSGNLIIAVCCVEMGKKDRICHCWCLIVKIATSAAMYLEKIEFDM